MNRNRFLRGSSIADGIGRFERGCGQTGAGGEEQGQGEQEKARMHAADRVRVHLLR